MKQYILTFEAIGAVRLELARAMSNGDSAAARDCHDRLCNLYASIDTASIVSELRQLAGENVVGVDFQTKVKAA